jgi:hypothetical protein
MPLTDVTAIAPQWASTIALTIASPTPAPSLPRCRKALSTPHVVIELMRTFSKRLQDPIAAPSTEMHMTDGQLEMPIVLIDQSQLVDEGQINLDGLIG